MNIFWCGFHHWNRNKIALRLTAGRFLIRGRQMPLICRQSQKMAIFFQITSKFCFFWLSMKLFWLLVFFMTTAINRAFQRYLYVYFYMSANVHFFVANSNFYRNNGYFLTLRWNWRHLAANWRHRLIIKRSAILLLFQKKKPHQKIIIFRVLVIFALNQS